MPEPTSSGDAGASGAGGGEPPTGPTSSAGQVVVAASPLARSAGPAGARRADDRPAGDHARHSIADHPAKGGQRSAARVGTYAPGTGLTIRTKPRLRTQAPRGIHRSRSARPNLPPAPRRPRRRRGDARGGRVEGGEARRHPHGAAGSSSCRHPDGQSRCGRGSGTAPEVELLEGDLDDVLDDRAGIGRCGGVVEEVDVTLELSNPTRSSPTTRCRS